MNDIKDACIIAAVALLGIAGAIFFSLLAIVLTAAPIVLIVIGCLYAWKAIIG